MPQEIAASDLENSERQLAPFDAMMDLEMLPQESIALDAIADLGSLGSRPSNLEFSENTSSGTDGQRATSSLFPGPQPEVSLTEISRVHEEEVQVETFEFGADPSTHCIPLSWI